MTFGVDPARRRRGLGSELLLRLQLVLRAQQYTRVSLHVQLVNEAAVTFYKKCGFSVVERLPQHYLIDGKHYDALYMRKQLV